MVARQITDEARLAEIEDRLDNYRWAVNFATASPASVNAKFLGQDVPWLISRVRQLGLLLEPK